MEGVKRYLNPKNYLRYAINKFLAFSSPVIRIWEKKYLEKFGSMPLKHQPVFIIGAPRTGSTIFYQLLTNQLDVLYVDNLVCKFYRNFFFGFWLSDRLFHQRAHNCFESDHGNTSMCGWHAPSECGQFWYRWLPRDRHFIDYSDITEKMVKEIRKEITTVINYFDKPLVFKNLNAGQRMRLIKHCFPKAKFIFVKRKPIYVAQSILRAKRKLKIKDNKWWSIMPPNVEKLRKLNGYVQVVKQIFYLEKQIMKDKDLFPPQNFIIIHYEEICENLEKILDLCKSFIGAKSRKNFLKPKIALSNKFVLPQREIEILMIEINKLNWENYND